MKREKIVGWERTKESEVLRWERARGKVERRIESSDEKRWRWVERRERRVRVGRTVRGVVRGGRTVGGRGAREGQLVRARKGESARNDEKTTNIQSRRAFD